jgi:(1->4)-alpha-D-glucan 1-alpha-D-glucosylmutase
MTLPRATLRLQFHAGFTFLDAAGLAPYLQGLGISHLYASPILKARAGSMHGYDTVDPGRVNPELGGEDGFRHLVGALRRHDLGLIVDIVPNHMAVGGADNAWWLDVLEHGPESRYARFFDIDWKSPEPDLTGKLLAPFLGQPYGEALAAGEIQLGPHPEDGRPAILYFHHVFPLRPEDVGLVRRKGEARFDPSDPEGRARLHALLERQHYRLAWWRTASDLINWRRFFDITELAGLRIEDDVVFEAVHATSLRLYREGLIDGFRVDHVDGLTDPAGYCRTLRATLIALEDERPADAPAGPAYLVVEKILGRGESLPADWGVDGTTGYDFMNEASAVLHDPAGRSPLCRLWSKVSGRPGGFEAEEDLARRELLGRSFAGQVGAAAGALHALTARDPATRDWSRRAVGRALTEILVAFRVYRTYAGGPRLPLEQALEKARARCRPGDAPLLDLLADLLEMDPGGDALIARAQARFRQLSAPIAAKSVEDTGFYRYGRLLSRTDVGFDPGIFALDAEGFHGAMRRRRETFPGAMLASATHDHKRGEDVRARLAVISEMPDCWEDVLGDALLASEDWRVQASSGPAPSDGDRAILMQMVAGAWPLDLDPADRAGVQAFAERLGAWQMKALREAKLRTSWDAPDEAYETAARTFLDRLLGDPATAELRDFAREIAPAGALNSLTQTLLKLTVPGMPDLYQGTEFWDFSLVDPDNRRPVDWPARQAALADTRSLPACIETWRDGTVKQALIRQALALRAELPDVFAAGDYLPVEAEGPMAAHVLAFLRTHEGRSVLVTVPHLAAHMVDDDAPTILPELWRGTRLILPEIVADVGFLDVLTATPRTPKDGTLDIADLLDTLPVALLRAT